MTATVAEPIKYPPLMPGVARRWLPYKNYVPYPGDVLLWEPHSVEGKAICLETKGPFSHASGVVILNGRPWQAGYQEGMNGYLSPLSAEVRRHNGKISVFRPHDPETKRPCGPDVQSRVQHELMNSLGGDYAWENLALIYAGRSRLAQFLSWLPFIGSRLKARWHEEVATQSHRKTSAICSQNVARAWLNGAGIDLAEKPLALVSPNDLGRGCKECYVGTLTWPQEWKK